MLDGLIGSMVYEINPLTIFYKNQMPEKAGEKKAFSFKIYIWLRQLVGVFVKFILPLHNAEKTTLKFKIAKKTSDDVNCQALCFFK